MAQLPAQFQKDFSAGQVNNLNTNIMPKGSVELAMNMDADEEIGSLVSRLGTGKVADQLVNGETVLGLHDFQDSVGSNNRLVATINASGGASSVVYNVGTGTIRTGLTADLKMRFLVFLDSILMLNGGDAIASYNGSTVITTGGAFDIGNIPASDVTIVEEFLDRVYLAGDVSEPDRLYHSGVAGSGAVSWTVGNGSTDIEPEDGGGKITALSKVPGYLIIFKERSMKRWNFSSAFPESLVDIGTPTQECVVKGGGLVAFYSSSNKDDKGFFITNGGRPVPISHDRVRGIKKWVDAIPQGNEAGIAGFATDRIFGWSIGDVTVDGFDYKNVVVRYNRRLDQWSVRSYPSNFHHFSTYVSSSVNVMVGGDDDGTIIEIDKAGTYDDHSSATNAQVPIFYEAKLHPENFGFNQKKELTEKIIVRTRNADGARIQIEADGKRTDHDGVVRSPVTSVDLPRRVMSIPIGKQVRGNEFLVSLSGEVDGARAYLSEVEYPHVNVLKSW